MARPLSIAIVGAGMGGLAAAAALRRVGIDASVYEQASQFARLGAGIQIGCNAMKVLRGLGLEERLRSQSFYPRSWNNRDWRTGDVKFDMIFGESAEQKFGAPYLLAHRGDLHAALASAVPDELVKLNHKLVGLDETGDGVRLSFANGETAIADAVIGADGIHSVVRDILFDTSPVHFTGRIAYRTTYPAALLGGEKIDDCTKWWGEDRHIVIYYVKPDRSEIYLVTSQPEPEFRIESWSAKGDVRELRKAFAGFDLARSKEPREPLARARLALILGRVTVSTPPFLGARSQGKKDLELAARLIRELQRGSLPEESPLRYGALIRLERTAETFLARD